MVKIRDFYCAACTSDENKKEDTSIIIKTVSQDEEKAVPVILRELESRGLLCDKNTRYSG